MDKDLIQLLEQIETKARLMPFKKDMYNYKHWEVEKIDYVYNTNAIEGNSLTKRETYLAVIDRITIAGKSLSHHLEAVASSIAFDYVLDLSCKREILTKRDILQIHSIVMRDNPSIAGKLRNIDVNIGGSSHRPPSYLEVNDLFECMVECYSKTMPITLKEITEFHCKFENLHPFLDGNGRTGRFVLNLELIRYGYFPVNIKFSNRADYYDFLEYYDTTGSIDKLLYIILKQQEEQQNQIKQLSQSKVSHDNN